MYAMMQIHNKKGEYIMKKVLALILVIMTFMVVFPAAAVNFTDINASHWAYSAINELVGKGTIGGYTDGSFRPNNTVTRAEFVKMVGVGSTKRKNDYADVPPEHWAYKYVITSGFKSDSENRFNPDKPITRAQTVELLYDRFGKADVIAPPFVKAEAKKFAIDEDALSWIYTYGILVGDDGLNLRLGDTLTRAEAAALIVKCGKSTVAKDTVAIISDKVLANYAEGINVFEGGYKADKTLTNAQLAVAVAKFANNTAEIDFSKYSIKSSIDHENSKELYIMCNSNIGLGKFTVAFANESATVDTVEKAVKNAAERLAATVINNPAIIYNKSGKTTKATQKDVVALMIQYDVMFGSQYAYTTEKSGESYKRINVSVETNGQKYPAGYKNFAVVLKDVPNEVYTHPISNGTPKDLYDFAREYAPLFAKKCDEYVFAAEKGFGVKLKITFYPSLAYSTGTGYAFRVKVTALNTTKYTPADLFGEGAITKTDKKLTGGTEFFAEITVDSIV